MWLIEKKGKIPMENCNDFPLDYKSRKNSDFFYFRKLVIIEQIWTTPSYGWV